MKRRALLVLLATCTYCETPKPVPAERVAVTAQPKPPDRSPAPRDPSEARIDALIANASKDPPAPPPKPQPRNQALAGIAAWRGIIQRRTAVGAQSDDACDQRHTAEAPQLDAANKQLGQYWLDRKTRYSDRAPDLNATVETFAVSCLGCTSPDDDERVPHECKQALVALDDLAAEIKAAKICTETGNSTKYDNPSCVPPI
jgi:hypothetical protein